MELTRGTSVCYTNTWLHFRTLLTYFDWQVWARILITGILIICSSNNTSPWSGRGAPMHKPSSWQGLPLTSVLGKAEQVVQGMSSWLLQVLSLATAASTFPVYWKIVFKKLSCRILWPTQTNWFFLARCRRFWCSVSVCVCGGGYRASYSNSSLYQVWN